MEGRLSYSVTQAAEQLSVGRSTMFELIKAGDVLAIKIGRRTVVPATSIETYLFNRIRERREGGRE